MDRKSRAEENEANRLVYVRGFIALTHSIAAFRELTGIDLTDAVDTAGRHVGEAPYLKVTAERLDEITAQIEGDVANVPLALVEVDPAPVVSLADRGRTSCFPKIDNPGARMVLTAYRPDRTS